MARRRMISQDIIIDEHFNGLSIEAQNLFIRLIAVSDDCGVVPCSEYTIICLTNPPEKIKKNIFKYLDEIITMGLGKRIEYNGKPFFVFKKDSFERYQNYIINKRVKSEYLRISADEFDSIDFDSFESKCEHLRQDDIESIKYKVVSKEDKKEVKDKEEKERHGEFKNVLLYAGEFEKLVAKEGRERTDAAIEILSAYMESKGKKYKSHYAALRSWVFGALDEKKSTGKSKLEKAHEEIDRIGREKFGSEK